MPTAQSAPDALAKTDRLKISLDSCIGIPRNSRRTYEYYISFRMDNQKSKERSQRLPVSAENVVTWAQNFRFTFELSSELEVRLKEVHLYGNRTVAVKIVKISDLWNAQESAERDAFCTLHLAVEIERDAGRALMNDVVAGLAEVSLQSRTGDMVFKTEDSLALGTAVLSSIGDWGPLLDKIKIGADIVQGLAEMNMYTKIAWGIISAGYELAQKQKKRDDNVARLLEALCSSYDAVIAMDGLKDLGDAQVKSVAIVIKHTVTCGTFIKSYLAKGFWGRAVRGALSSTDADIEDFLAQFEKLERNLITFATLTTQRRVEAVLGDTSRILDDTERILNNTERILNAAERYGNAAALKDMPCTTTAGWRSDKTCLPETRKELISRILDWAFLSGDEAPRVLLLTGVAGVGKSSVANTIASHLQNLSHLSASYCFDRNSADTHKPELLIPTIAHQLASNYSAYAHSLALMNNPVTFGTLDLNNQFKTLLLDPLANQTFSGPVFIVVDALDECANRADRATLLRILTDRFVELPSQVRLIVTSRPEEDIRDAFSDLNHVQTIHIDTDDNEEDITTFVASKLVDRKGKPLAAFSSADHLAIATKAEGLFQWAAVVCALIVQSKNPNLPPSKTQMRSTYERFVSLRSGALDELYDETLTRLFPESSEDDQLLSRVLGLIVASQQPLSASSVFELLQIPEEKRESCFIMLQSLGALLTGLSSQEDEIRTIHSSFRDYLFQIGQDQRFHIDQDVLHCDTTIGSLRVLNDKLKFNICGLESSYVANGDVTVYTSEHLTPLLIYAALLWGYHLTQTKTKPFALEVELGVFLRNKFLFWLELLSICDEVNVASPALSASYSRVTTEELKNIIADCRRFVRTCGKAISHAAPHVYLSAYAFAPSTALVHQQPYSQHMRHLPKLNGILESWPRLDILIHAGGSSMSSVAFSPDGCYIVSGSYDNEVRIWDAETGAEAAAPFKGHAHCVTSVAYSPDGRRIASGSYDKTVCIWDAEMGLAVGTPFEGHTDQISAVAYSPDGRHVVSGSADRTIRIWNVETGAAVGAPLEGHTNGITSVAYSPDGHHIASGSADMTVRIWDANTGTAVGAPLEGHTDLIHSVVYSPNGDCIASGSADKTVRIWNADMKVASGAPLAGHTAGVCSVAYSPDGRRVVSGSEDMTIRIWDTDTRTVIGTPLEGHTEKIYSVAFSPDGRHIVSGSRDMTVCVWDTEMGVAAVAPLESHSSFILCVAYSPDGRRVVSGSGDRTARIWDTNLGVMVGAPLEGHLNRISSLAYSPDGHRIVSGSWDNTLRIWNAETGTAVGAPLEGHTDFIMSVAYSHDGLHIVSGSCDCTVQIWDAKTGAAVGTPLEGHTGPIYAVAFSPDDRRIVSGSKDMTVRIWDAEKGIAVGAPFEGHKEHVSAVAYSPDGHRIVSGSWDYTLRIWDVETGKVVGAPLRGHRYLINSVAYSPDGRNIVSSASDTTVRIWDAETGASVGNPLWIHARSAVLSVGYSPDGRYVVSGSDDLSICIWNVGEINRFTSMCTFSSDIGHALKNYPCTQPSRSQDQLDQPLPSFYLTEDGWLVDVSCKPSKLLLWIPVEYRRTLQLPHMSRIIAPLPAYTLDLSDFAHGTRWTECYDNAKE